MSYITDRHHLAKITQRGIAALLDLQDAWLEEDHLAHTPPANNDGTRTSNRPADPTPNIATHPNKTRDRDHLGNFILNHVTKAEQILKNREPHTPTEPCHCCHNTMATHGKLCWACNLYLHKVGYPCTEDIHEGRPNIRMCECPPECCDVCPDKIAEGRTSLSDRCAQRISRRARREEP